MLRALVVWALLSVLLTCQGSTVSEQKAIAAPTAWYLPFFFPCVIEFFPHRSSPFSFTLYYITWGPPQNRSETQGDCTIQLDTQSGLTNWSCTFYIDNTTGHYASLVAQASTFTPGVQYNTYTYELGANMQQVPTQPWGAWF